MTTPVGIAVLIIIAFAAGLLIMRLFLAGKLNKQKQDIVSLQTRLSVQQEMAEIHQQQLHAQEQALKESFLSNFAALSGEALQKNNDAFIQLANENFAKQQNKAESRLSDKEKSFSNLIKPIRDTLDKTDAQLQKLEKDRLETHGSINQYLKSMAESQTQLQLETRNLVQAFRRPEVRGQWGELTLKRLVELAGLVEHCDFFEQEHTQGEEGTSAMRPDMVIRMPDKREVVVDAKTPLDAYLTATEQTDEKDKQIHLIRHARQVRDRVRELSKKAYWSQFKNAPDFVVLFIPGDQFLSAALEQDQDLLEDALRQKVILATPTSFVALLRAVAFGWRQQAASENAELIRELGETMYTRLVTFVDHLGRIGSSLDKSVEHYNKAVGSLERQVFPSARRFQELGIETKKTLTEADSIERTARKPATIDVKNA